MRFPKGSGERKVREGIRPHFFTRRVFASVPENAEPIPLKNRARYRQ